MALNDSLSKQTTFATGNNNSAPNQQNQSSLNQQESAQEQKPNEGEDVNMNNENLEDRIDRL